MEELVDENTCIYFKYRSSFEHVAWPQWVLVSCNP
jgi:hypothetical protein